jgi:hypothetical protein
MGPEDLIRLIVLAATILWSYAAVVGVEWARMLWRSERREHVTLVFDLVTGLLPAAAAYVLLVLAGHVLGLPSVVVFLAVVVPGGLVYAFRASLVDRGLTGARREQGRLLIALALAVAVVATRGLR